MPKIPKARYDAPVNADGTAITYPIQRPTSMMAHGDSRDHYRVRSLEEAREANAPTTNVYDGNGRLTGWRYVDPMERYPRKVFDPKRPFQVLVVQDGGYAQVNTSQRPTVDPWGVDVQFTIFSGSHLPHEFEAVAGGGLQGVGGDPVYLGGIPPEVCVTCSRCGHMDAAQTHTCISDD